MSNLVFGYEGKKFFVEGSEKYEFPEIKRVVYVHFKEQVIIVWEGARKKPVHNARYRASVEQFSEAVEQELKSCQRRVQEVYDWEEKCKKECEDILKNAKVGDVYYSSWGWEQTNIDFYQVVAIKGKKFSFRKLKSEINEYSSHSMQGRCSPLVDQFAKDEDDVFSKSLSKSARFKKSSFEDLRRADFDLIDGERVYQSHYFSNGA